MLRNTVMGFSIFVMSSGFGVELDDMVLAMPQEFSQELLDVEVEDVFDVAEHGVKQSSEREKVAFYTMDVEATAYISFCETGCTGVTRTGTDVRESVLHPSGLKIVATDPDVIPLGSVLEIGGELYVADDTGGAIKGNRIDLLMDVDDPTDAYKFGRQDMTVKIFAGELDEVVESAMIH